MDRARSGAWDNVRVRPFDPRLLSRARATRSFLVAAILVGFGQGLLIIGQAWFLADAITKIFLGREPLTAITNNVGWLVAIVAARAALTYAMEASAFGASARVKSQLRMAVVSKTMAVGPQRLSSSDTAGLAQLTGRGIDALDAYFARYLPQLVLAVIVPLAIGVTILTQDILSAVIIALTLPLIPVFMVLIGLYTQSQVNRQWRTLSQLSGYFLDLIAGLPTLRIFGRAKAQAQQLQEVGDRYRQSTMRVLRVSFLSALALELLATLSVAIIAVSIGLRLVEGNMFLGTALFVLILAPEAYLPVRQVGMHFHAAAEGLGAADRLLTWLDEPVPAAGGGPAPDVRGSTIVLAGVSAGYDDTEVLAGFSANLEPGRITALVGPSGAGKSTILRLLLHFLAPTQGRISLLTEGDAVDQASINPDSWRSQIAWVPQNPVLLPGTVLSNVMLGAPTATAAQAAAALAAAGLTASELPAGYDSMITEGGSGVSVGQRRRIALARALLRDSPVVLLDEPTAALDPITERAVVTAVRSLRDSGAIVVVVAHRQALIDIADTVVAVPLLARAVGDRPRRSDQLLPGVGR